MGVRRFAGAGDVDSLPQTLKPVREYSCEVDVDMAKQRSNNLAGGLALAGMLSLPLVGYYGGNLIAAPAREREAHRVNLNVAEAQRGLPKSPHAVYYGHLLSAHNRGQPMVTPADLHLIDSAARKAGVHPSRVVETLRRTSDLKAAYQDYHARWLDAQGSSKYNFGDPALAAYGRQFEAIHTILEQFQGNGPAGELAARIRANQGSLAKFHRSFGAGQGTSYKQAVTTTFKGPVYLPPEERVAPPEPLARPQPTSRGSQSRGQVRRTQNRGSAPRGRR